MTCTCDDEQFTQRFEDAANQISQIEFGVRTGWSNDPASQACELLRHAVQLLRIEKPLLVIEEVLEASDYVDIGQRAYNRATGQLVFENIVGGDYVRHQRSGQWHIYVRPYNDEHAELRARLKELLTDWNGDDDDWSDGYVGPVGVTVLGKEVGT